jgi:hypothetical protein
MVDMTLNMIDILFDDVLLWILSNQFFHLPSAKLCFSIFKLITSLLTAFIAAGNNLRRRQHNLTAMSPRFTRISLLMIFLTFLLVPLS